MVVSSVEAEDQQATVHTTTRSVEAVARVSTVHVLLRYCRSSSKVGAAFQACSTTLYIVLVPGAGGLPQHAGEDGQVAVLSLGTEHGGRDFGHQQCVPSLPVVVASATPLVRMYDAEVCQMGHVLLPPPPPPFCGNASTADWTGVELVCDVAPCVVVLTPTTLSAHSTCAAYCVATRPVVRGGMER